MFTKWIKHQTAPTESGGVIYNEQRMKDEVSRVAAEWAGEC